MKPLLSLLLFGNLFIPAIGARTQAGTTRSASKQRPKLISAGQDVSGTWETSYYVPDASGRAVPAIADLSFEQNGDDVKYCGINKGLRFCYKGQYITADSISVAQYEPPNSPKTTFIMYIDDSSHIHNSANLRFYRVHDLCGEANNADLGFLKGLKPDNSMFRTMTSGDPPSVSQTSAFDAWKKGEVFASQTKYSDALFWYERAAAKGNVDAEVEIGSFYLNGLGVEKSEAMSARWDAVAASGQSPLGTQRLAHLYFRGAGVKNNPSRALSLGKRAYCLGESNAAFYLASIYAHGAPGFPQSQAVADSWSARGLAELAKAQTVCELKSNQAAMASLMGDMYERLYTSPTAMVLLSAMAMTNTPLNPQPASRDERKVTEVTATLRHGDGEVECNVSFSVEPVLWAFRINRVPDGYFVTAATGGEWVTLVSNRINLALGGVKLSTGLHDLYIFSGEAHQHVQEDATQRSGDSGKSPEASTPSAGVVLDRSRQMVLSDCEGGDCGAGGSGPGTWIINGKQGSARWNYGAVATLTVQRFDAQSVVIYRKDSSGSSPGLTAIYTGTIHGNQIVGSVTWTWPGHFAKPATGQWHATVSN